MQTSQLIRAIARAFLAGDQTLNAVVSRAEKTLGREWRWLRPVASRYLDLASGGVRPRERDVRRFLKNDRSFRRALSRLRGNLSVADWMTEPQQMMPVPAAAGWDLPRIESAGVLCEWLWLDPDQLDWFADLKALNRKDCGGGLSHYYYRLLTKTNGDIRLIEAPKARLKNLQQQILNEILNRVPPHPQAQGFVRSRSIKSFAAPHAGRRVILRMDLSDFFPTLQASRIKTLFRTAGYPESVADLLGGLCTNAVPRGFWKRAEADLDSSRLQHARLLYSVPHLPQGAPTSPSLANICCYRMDCRLTGLAKSAGATYTRYADDLAFSGDDDFNRRVDRFATSVAAIVAEEGFAVNHRKTRIMRRGVRQHLAGIVVNEHLNVRRLDFDLLKATLTNCIRFGPSSQNHANHPDFRAHLQGKVAFVESVNALRGRRLRELLSRIQW